MFTSPLSRSVIWFRGMLLMVCLTHSASITAGHAAPPDRADAMSAQSDTELVQALSSRDSMAVYQARRALVQRGQAAVPAVVDYLRAVDEPGAAHYRMAIRILGDIGDSQALPVLTDLLGDRTLQLRVAAAQALGALGDAAAVDALMAALLEDDVSTALRAEIYQALGAIGDPKPIRVLMSRVQTEQMPDLRSYAALALDRIAGTDFRYDNTARRQWIMEHHPEWWANAPPPPAAKGYKMFGGLAKLLLGGLLVGSGAMILLFNRGA